MKAIRIFAKTNTTSFYTEDGQLIPTITLQGEYIPFELARYRKNDFIGYQTGKVKKNPFGQINRIEVEVSYVHLMNQENNDRPKTLENTKKLWLCPNEILKESQVSWVINNPFARFLSQSRILLGTIKAKEDGPGNWSMANFEI